MWIYNDLSIRVFVVGYLCCFHHLVIMNNATSCGNCMFNLFKSYQTISHSCCFISRYRQQCIRVPVCLHPHQQLFFWVFIHSHSIKCDTVPHCGLICIFLMIKNVEYLLICLFVTWISIWRHAYSGPLRIFWLGWLSCRCWVERFLMYPGY